jgi:hypothetical protein
MQFVTKQFFGIYVSVNIEYTKALFAGIIYMENNRDNEFRLLYRFNDNTENIFTVSGISWDKMIDLANRRDDVLLELLLMINKYLSEKSERWSLEGKNITFKP